MNRKLQSRSTLMAAGALLLVLLVLLGASSVLQLFPDQQAGQPVKLYFADNISPAHQRLIDAFNREYSGQIELVPVNLPFTKFSTNERKELLARAMRSKSDRIDVFAVDLIWVPRFAKWAEPLNDYFHVQSDLQDILPAAITSCSYGGRLVAIPFYLDIGLMYYRKDLLPTLGSEGALEKELKESITWEHLLALGRQRPETVRPLYLFAAKNFEGLMCSFWELYYGLGNGPPENDGIQLDWPRARQALQFLVDLVQKYRFTPVEVTRFDEMATYRFALETDALFFRGWPGIKRNVHLSDPELNRKLQRVQPAALPHFAGKPALSVFGGWNLMISRYSTKKEAAVKFLRFVLRRESQKKMYLQGGYLPVKGALYNDPDLLATDPDLPYYQKLIQRGVHRPFDVDYTKISEGMALSFHRAIKGEITVEEALNQVQKILPGHSLVNR
ncbi:MAG: extracellular solute-binding protein [Calditrichaeota bacterium]|nr:MAG: extracellular solute-binding protein [Calditrichota bacterium]